MTVEQDDAETPLLPGDATNGPNTAQMSESKRKRALLVSFIGLVIIGLGNKIFQKLQARPMYNYPYFLSVYVTFIYIPLSFAYIFPMFIWGKHIITKEQRNIRWYKFAVMGILDGIAGVMQTFAVNYIPSGGLIILLTQSAIPISMIISKLLLKVKYQFQHYTGAVIVIIGLVVVLLPQFLHPAANDEHESPAMIGVWCGVLILSCVPMTLSSVYKEKALGELEIDVIYLNGWVAIYQFLLSLAVAVPLAYASQLTPKDIPYNFADGAKCYVGINTITGGAHLDECQNAPLFVNLYIAFNVLYNILIILILKYGSANLLWLAMTLMVPLGNGAFALPFVPGNLPMTYWDIIGLIVIMGGLILYRFFGLFKEKFLQHKHHKNQPMSENGDPK